MKMLCKFFKRKKKKLVEPPLFNNYIWWSTEARVVGSLLSEYRATHNKKLLIPDINLHKSCINRVNYMAELEELGKPFVTITGRHVGFTIEADRLKELGFKAVMENLSWGYPPGRVVKEWDMSPKGHKRTMLADRVYYGVHYEKINGKNYCSLILSK